MHFITRQRLVVAATALFLAALAATAQEPIFTPFHKNGIYELGEEAGWTVTLAPNAPSAKYTFAIKKNNFDLIRSGSLDLSSGNGAIKMALNEPAMLYVDVRPEAGGQAIHLGAAIAPAKLKPVALRPSDFDAFWDAKLQALAKIPINPVLTAQTAKPGIELYTVQLDSVGSHVQGYLAKPARTGKLPALVILQWAGVYALQPDWITGRAAEGWLVMDVDSHDIPPDQSTGVSTNYGAIGNTDRETSYFLNMYLRDSRAVDYITSRPDWNGKTVVVMGTSMGGQQSLVTAALNHKVTDVIVNEPAGADSNAELHGRKAGYPNWPSTDPKVMETALYFDTVNFAPRIKAPVLAAIGFIDTVCPPAGIWTAIDQIPGPKEVVPMIESDHNNITPNKQRAFEIRSREVLGIILNGGRFVPASM